MKVIHGNEAMEKLKRGVDIMANAVKSTLGPNGKNVVFSSGGMPLVTKDGVTVAREVMLKDEGEYIAVKIMRQAAMKTNQNVADGTTTSTVLAQAIVTLGMDALQDKSLNVHTLRKGIQDCAEEIKEKLKEQSQSVEGKLHEVATISANNDPLIGKQVSDCVEKAGPDGLIVVEESKSLETTIDEIDGMELERGYVSPYMANNEKLECVMHNPLIAVAEKKLSLSSEVLPLMENIVKNKQTRELLLICEDIEGDALTTVVANKLKAAFNLVVVRSPGAPSEKKDILRDIASYVDTDVISDQSGLKLSTYDTFGSAEKVVITKDKALIIKGKGDPASRIQDLKTELDLKEHDHEKEKLKARIAKLLGKVIVLKVGGATDAEMREKKYLYEDAVGATKASLKSGIIGGGGIPLYHLSETIQAKDKGSEILLKAIQEPFKTIIRNSGQDTERIVKGLGTGGYDAKKDQFVPDMVEAKIIDPLEVTVNALDNAVSVATTILTTDCLMYHEPDKKE